MSMNGVSSGVLERVPAKAGVESTGNSAPSVLVSEIMVAGK